MASWGALVDGYYKQTKTATNVSNVNPIWGLFPSAVLPTTVEESNYNMLKFLVTDGNTLTIYSKTKPTADISIIIKGVA